MLGVVFLIALVVIIYYFIHSISLTSSAHSRQIPYTTILLSVVGPLFSGIFCLKGSFRHLKRSSSSHLTRQTRRFSPILLGVSGLIFASGQIIGLGQILATQQMPSYMAPSHFIELLTCVCLIAAVLLLPSHNLSMLVRLRIFLDSLIIMAAVTTLCYYYILAPLLINGEGTFLAKAISGAYPAADLVLMFCILLVALRSNEPDLRPVLAMMAFATILRFVAHVVHLYELLYKSYNEFSVVNICMIAFGALMIAVAQIINAIQNKDEATGQAPVPADDAAYIDTPWKAILPSMLVLAFGFQTLRIWLSPGREVLPDQIAVVYIGGFTVLVLLILRQFLTMYQIDVLRRKLRTRNRSLDCLNAQLVTLARTDPLTGLPNHRAMVEKLDEALTYAQEAEVPCSVVFIDIDDFKTINDYYGHTVGDDVLTQFARVVKSTLGEKDCLGRWGGEEFMTILPGMGPVEALQMAEQIRQSVSQRIFACEGGMNVTCSLGVATYPQDASRREDLIGRVDKALYTAKRLGRNQTRTAHEAMASAMAAQTPEATEDMHVSVSIKALLALLDARDPALSQHALRVGALSLKLARALNLDNAEARIVHAGGLLHDLGRVAMPDSLLSLHGKSGEAEREYLTRYPVAGAAILAPAPALRAVATVVRAHRERIDGSGYPDGLKGEEIPLGARIVAVASFYDAHLGRQDPHQACSSSRVLKELRSDSGLRFDPRVVDALAGVLAGSSDSPETDVA